MQIGVHRMWLQPSVSLHPPATALPRPLYTPYTLPPPPYNIHFHFHPLHICLRKFEYKYKIANPMATALPRPPPYRDSHRYHICFATQMKSDDDWTHTDFQIDLEFSYGKTPLILPTKTWSIYVFSKCRRSALSAKQATCPHKPILFALKIMLKYSFIRGDVFHGSAFNLQNNFPSGRDPIPLRQSDSVLHVSFKSRCLVPSLPKSNSHQFVYNSDLRIFSAAVTVIWAFVIGLDACSTCFWLGGWGCCWWVGGHPW